MAHFGDDQAREIVRETYGHLTSHGPAVAEAFYAPDELAELPRGAVEFALGVANPVRHANLRAGENVLDLGCGAGIDTLLAARAVGSTGTAIGVDMTPEMVARARENAASAGLSNVEIRQGLIEELSKSPDPSSTDERRRYYRLTRFGMRVAAAEVTRLNGLVRQARATGLVPEN